MRPPRFRLWMLMVLVAVVAIGLEAVNWSKRSRYFRQRAAFWAKQEDSERKELASAREVLDNFLRVDQASRDADIPRARSWRRILGAVRMGFDSRKARADHFARLRLKYERAARYPFLTVEPDTPEPRVSRSF